MIKIMVCPLGGEVPAVLTLLQTHPGAKGSPELSSFPNGQMGKWANVKRAPRREENLDALANDELLL